MSKQKPKKPSTPHIDWPSILVSGAIDFFVGFLLLILDRVIK